MLSNSRAPPKSANAGGGRGAFCRFAPGHFLTFFEYAKNFQEIKKIQEVTSKMVIIERATDLWNPTLGTVSITKFKIRLEPFGILKIRIL